MLFVSARLVSLFSALNIVNMKTHPNQHMAEVACRGLLAVNQSWVKGTHGTSPLRVTLCRHPPFAININELVLAPLISS